MRWDLLGDPTRFHSLTWKNIKALAEEVEAVPSTVSPTLNGCHVGLHESILVAEGRAAPASLAFPLLMNETIWLPDPLVSFMSRTAKDRWEQTFEAGGTFYGAAAGARMPCRSLWSYPQDERKEVFRAEIPKLPPLEEVWAGMVFKVESVELDVATTRTFATIPLGAGQAYTSAGDETPTALRFEVDLPNTAGLPHRIEVLVLPAEQRLSVAVDDGARTTQTTKTFSGPVSK